MTDSTDQRGRTIRSLIDVTLEMLVTRCCTFPLIEVTQLGHKLIRLEERTSEFKAMQQPPTAIAASDLQTFTLLYTVSDARCRQTVGVGESVAEEVASPVTRSKLA